MNLIISLSGLDGVGKTTQCERIGSYLAEYYHLRTINTAQLCSNFFSSTNDLKKIYSTLSKYDVIISRMNLSNPSIEMLKKPYFSNKDFQYNELVSNMIQAVYESALMYLEEVINPLMALNNKIIIFDRYIYDEIAYRSLYDISPDKIEALYKDWPKPNNSFLLELQEKEVLKRNAERKDAKTPLYQNQIKIRQLINNFDELKRCYGLIGIDATLSEIYTSLLPYIVKIYNGGVI